MSSIKKRPLGFLCLAVMALLFLLVRIRPAPEEDYRAFAGKTVTVTGRVYAKETAVREQGPVQVLYLRLEKSSGPPGEKAVCYLAAGEREPEMGSTVKLSGRLSVFEKASDPGQFDARSYYQISGISYRLNQAKISAKTEKYQIVLEKLYQLRRFLSEKFSEALPDQEASVMQTMLLGEKSGMDRELKSLYQRNGIAHILAISGLHISLLGMGLYQLLRRCGVPMKAAAFGAFGLMLLYGVMTGFSVSALRAIFMFALRMLSILLERTYDMLTAAALAAVTILLGQPLYFGHSGFLFSFGCVAGIGLLVPLLTETGKPPKRNLPEKMLWQGTSALLGGLAVAVITLPIYLWFYYQFPVYSVLLNLLVIPLMSFLVGAGLLLLACELVCPYLSPPFVLLIKGVLRIYTEACGVCDSLPGNLFTPGRPQRWQIAAYLLLLLAVVLLGKRIKLRLRWGILALGLVLLIIRPEGELEITFLDVGQGDCIYLENDNGDCYLVDGGSSSVNSVGEYRIIPFLKFQGASCLEAVFVTHPDEDHCNGIRELLEQGREQGIRVRNLVLPDIAESEWNEGYQELVRLAGEGGIPVSFVSRGQSLENDRLIITCLHPEKEEEAMEPNEYSIVLVVSYGNFSALLTGDLEGDGEREFLQLIRRKTDIFPERITVLKAAHHGSRGSTPEELLDRVTPFYTVISCGEKNSYGHPHRELLERLEGSGTEILITYETGAVRFWTDGKRVQISRTLAPVS